MLGGLTNAVHPLPFRCFRSYISSNIYRVSTWRSPFTNAVIGVPFLVWRWYSSTFPLSCLSQEVSSLWALGQLVIGTIMQAGAISLQTQRFVEVSQPLNFQLRACSANLTCSNMNVRCLSDVTLVCVYLCFCFLRYHCPHRSTKLEEGLHYANCQEGNSRDLSWSMGDCHCRWRCFKF